MVGWHHFPVPFLCLCGMVFIWNLIIVISTGALCGDCTNGTGVGVLRMNCRECGGQYFYALGFLGKFTWKFIKFLSQPVICFSSSSTNLLFVLLFLMQACFSPSGSICTLDHFGSTESSRNDVRYGSHAFMCMVPVATEIEHKLYYLYICYN